MPDSDKPNPVEDLRKGLGLLFRAARTTLEKLPTGQIEEAVLSGAKEVGRALENVTHTVEEQFLRKPSARPPGAEVVNRDAPPAASDPVPAETKGDASKGGAGGDDPKTRVG